MGGPTSGWDRDEQPVYVAEPPPAAWVAPYGYPPQYGGQPAPYPGYGQYSGYPAAYPGQSGIVAPPQLVSEPVIGWVMVALAVLCVIGATGTWARVLDLDYPGTAFGAGKLVVVVSVVVVVCGLVIAAGRGGYGASVTACAGAILIAVVGMVNLLSGGTLVAQYQGLVHTGWGLWLTFVAGVALATTSILALMRRRPRALG